jgi:hypothetical protein
MASKKPVSKMQNKKTAKKPVPKPAAKTASKKKEDNRKVVKLVPKKIAAKPAVKPAAKPVPVKKESAKIVPLKPAAKIPAKEAAPASGKKDAKKAGIPMKDLPKNFKRADLSKLKQAADPSNENAPVLDDAAEGAIKKLIRKGKSRGYVTIDEINKVLPPDQVSSEQIEDTLAMFSEAGINVVESDEEEGEEAAVDEKDEEEEKVGNIDEDSVSRTDDPVRMYLREMGSVELLSREGEIALAKRIEAGREMMINGICESPLTIQAILAWHEALSEGKMLLREIIDLEATNAGENGTPEMPMAAPPAPPEPKPVAPPKEKVAGEEGEAETPEATEEFGSEFEDEDNSLSLSMLEEKVKPQVMDTFARIAVTYAKLFKVTATRHQSFLRGETLSKQADRKFDELKTDLVDLVRTIHFNNARLEQLVQQLYTLNRRLISLEGRLLRMATDCGVGRDEFLSRYYGHELNPNWLVAALEADGQSGKMPSASVIKSAACARRSPPSAMNPACPFPISAASSPPCSAAKRNPGAPRKKWWKPTSASSFPSPRNTPIAACNSLTLFRKEISA